MPTIDDTRIHGVDRHTKTDDASPKGHVSSVVYGRKDTRLWASIDDDTISVHFGSGGGSSTIMFDAATWDLIIAHVNAVRGVTA